MKRVHSPPPIDSPAINLLNFDRALAMCERTVALPQFRTRATSSAHVLDIAQQQRGAFTWRQLVQQRRNWPRRQRAASAARRFRPRLKRILSGVQICPRLRQMVDAAFEAIL
jgi:hypothetical protein